MESVKLADRGGSPSGEEEEDRVFNGNLKRERERDMFKWSSSKPASEQPSNTCRLIQPFFCVCERAKGRKGFTTTLFGDRNQLISRGMRIYTCFCCGRYGQCHSDLNAKTASTP